MGDIGATREEVEGSTKTTTLITIKIQSISTIKKTNIIKEVSNPTSITMTTITGTKVKIITNPVNNLIRIQLDLLNMACLRPQILPSSEDLTNSMLLSTVFSLS